MTMKPASKISTNAHLLTVKKIAIMDSCSEKTVRRAIESGALEAIWIGPEGRLLRIHPAAHEAYRKGKVL